MYGSIAKLKVAPDKRQPLEAALEQWQREVKPSADGSQDEYLFWPDADGSTGYLVAIYDDETTYRRNADRPEQDAWYQRFRGLLEADPQWIDGRFVSPAA